MIRSNLINRVKSDIRLETENNLIAWATGVAMTALFVWGVA